MGLIKDALEAVIRIDRNLAAIRKSLTYGCDDTLYRATYLQKPIEPRGSTYERVQTEKDFSYPDHLTLGGRLRAVRLFVGLNQTDLANEIGISSAHVSKLESDIATPSGMLIRAVGLRWNIDEHWLATGERMPVDSVDRVSETVTQSIRRHMGIFDPEPAKAIPLSGCDWSQNLPREVVIDHGTDADLPPVERSPLVDKHIG